MFRFQQYFDIMQEIVGILTFLSQRVPDTKMNNP